MSTPVSGPVCALCGQVASVNWVRRLTDDELAALIANEQAQRDQILTQYPAGDPPAFGPMPAADNSTRVVFACAQHAITLDLAALIHANTCTAPNAADLPNCDCTPTAFPPPSPLVDKQLAARPLPDHWQPPAA